MAEDIVRRMRDPELCMCDGENPCVVCVALTEIERLRAELKRLRTAGDALAATWPEEDRCGCNNKDCRAVVEAFDAWQEARRAR